MNKTTLVSAFLATLTIALPTWAGEWSSVASMERGRSHLAAAAVGNDILVAGGSGLLAPLSTFEVYDSNYDYWRPLPNMPEAREQFTMTALGGEAYVIGGFGEEGRTAPQSGVWIYTHSISSWREGPDMPIALARHASVGVNGSVYVFGGVEEGGAASDRIFVLSGAGAGWRQLSVHMPEPLADMAIAALDGKIYVLGGRRESGEVTSRVDVFDPATQSWSRAPAMPGARAEHTADTVDGQIHVAGGVAGNVFQTYADHFTYDAAMDRWHTAEPLRSPRHSLASATVGGKWYVVGGGAGAGLFTEFTEADTLEVYDPSGSE